MPNRGHYYAACAIFLEIPLNYDCKYYQCGKYLPALCRHIGSGMGWGRVAKSVKCYKILKFPSKNGARGIVVAPVRHKE